MADPIKAANELTAVLRGVSAGSHPPRRDVKALLSTVSGALSQNESIYTSGGNEHRVLLRAAALGHYYLGQYKFARERAHQLVDLDPTNTNALELKDMIEEAIDKDGKIGLAIVGGVVAATAATVALLWRR
eukprot:m.169034 g.169034  ORF g.169034 m.169034 type:complete len:131 (-) comp13039_c0_seq1:260-652(-)